MVNVGVNEISASRDTVLCRRGWRETKTRRSKLRGANERTQIERRRLLAVERLQKRSKDIGEWKNRLFSNSGCRGFRNNEDYIRRSLAKSQPPFQLLDPLAVWGGRRRRKEGRKDFDWILILSSFQAGWPAAHLGTKKWTIAGLETGMAECSLSRNKGGGSIGGPYYTP
jgi:hypothetical protein